MDRKSSRPTSWTDLPYDLLVRIFLSLNIVDLVIGAARTCRSWRAACNDPVPCETVDLSFMRTILVRITGTPYSASDEESSNRLKLALNARLNLNHGNMTCLIFNFHVYIKGKEWISVAQRSPKLKRLVLPAWNQINLEAFKDVVKYWKDLESLTIPYRHRCERILKSLDSLQEFLSELKILCTFPIHFANAIVAHVPNFKVLSLHYIAAYEDAALHLLTNMKHLEVLNLTNVLVAYIDPQRSPDRSMLFRCVDREIIECALQLKKFLFCTDFRCPKCNGNSITDHSAIRWHQFEEEHWRLDEVPSLAV